ncbi:MAG: hypothetical protein RSC78_01635 [Acidaminococcaceae bacterium]
MQSPDLTPLEIKIIKALQAEFPLVPEPYRILAQELGLAEAELLAILTTLQQRGLLKRISVALRHNNVGYTTNVMLVWDVPAAQVATVARLLTADSHITHCYERAKSAEFDYNLYSMTHATGEEEYQAFLDTITSAVGSLATKYLALRTKRELKKIGMKYFEEVPVDMPSAAVEVGSSL